MKSNFEERKLNRLEAYERLAAKNASIANSAYKAAKDIGSYIPMGQPILVGHHSEKRHRKDLERIDNNMRKSIEAGEKSEYYKQRIENLLNGSAISSDDPNAIDKLTEKAERLQQLQDLMKAVNKIVKSKKSDIEKLDSLRELGISEQRAIKLMEKGDGWHNQPGFPPYRLTNNNANLKRVKDRIEYLQRIASIESSEEQFDGAKLVVSSEDNRVQIFFDSKPSEEVRKRLKSNGFRWAPSVGAWMRQTSNYAIYVAKTILTGDVYLKSING
jgi:hypothetical protein